MDSHHLSYDPELVVVLCYHCHMFVHSYAKYSNEQINIVQNWFSKYSGQWANAKVKYLKSKIYKNSVSSWHDEHKSRVDKMKAKYVANNPDKVTKAKRDWYIREKAKKELGLNISKLSEQEISDLINLAKEWKQQLN